MGDEEVRWTSPHEEYRLMVFPMVSGKGKRLFGDGIDTKVLELEGTEMFGSGIVVLTYQPVSA